VLTKSRISKNLYVRTLPNRTLRNSACLPNLSLAAIVNYNSSVLRRSMIHCKTHIGGPTSH
jgi:hypothetical protein